MSIILESINDILEIDESKLKSQEKSAVIRKIKQLVKSDNKKEAVAENYPYEAVSIVGNKYVEIKFDLNSKEARVVDTFTHTSDVKGKNYMVGSKAISRITSLAREQKEISND